MYRSYRMTRRCSAWTLFLAVAWLAFRRAYWMSSEALIWFGSRISSTVAGGFSAQPASDQERISAASRALIIIGCSFSGFARRTERASALPAVATALARHRLFELEMGALDQILPLLDVGMEEPLEVRLIVLEQRHPGLAQVRARF